ncbi:MAG: DNA-binding protein [Clostridia bacterium]|nr:DNA-binding protein [Clostridia bacterium]
MEKRVELTLLMDFYGPLLTERRREILRLVCEEDMSFQEIADQMSITRQGVHDAVKAAARQLNRYEAALGLVERYRRIRSEVKACRALLDSVQADGASRAALDEARSALDRISGIEEME